MARRRDDPVFMPIVLLLLSGCSLPLLVIFLFFVVAGWLIALIFRRYGLAPTPEGASEKEDALTDYPLTKDGGGPDER